MCISYFMFVSVDSVHSRWYTEIKVGEKLIDVAWPSEQSNKLLPTIVNYIEQGTTPYTNIKEFVKKLNLGMFVQVI